MISRYYGSLDRPTNTRNCRRPEREENPIPGLSVWLEFYKDILQFRWITPSKAQSAVCAWFYTRSTLCAAWKTLTARQSGSKDLAETYVFRLDSRIYKLLPLFCISRNNNCSCHFVNLKSRSTDAPRWAKTICCCCHVEIINGCDFFSFWTIAFCQRKTFKWKYKVMKRRKKNRVTAVLLRIRRTENQEKRKAHGRDWVYWVPTATWQLPFATKFSFFSFCSSILYTAMTSISSLNRKKKK